MGWRGVALGLVVIHGGAAAEPAAPPLPVAEPSTRHAVLIAGGAFAVVTSAAYAMMLADDGGCVSPSVLAGPVLGLRLGRHGGRTGPLVGIEGGVGCGAERVNLGFEHRAGRGLAYLEVDPWFAIGASFGVGIDTAGTPQGILGVWEGVPVVNSPLRCDTEKRFEITLAAGYRYTGEHELYVTAKTGVWQGGLDITCSD
jgi:hypothetical protein